jgi:hypothetical protein
MTGPTLSIINSLNKHLKMPSKNILNPKPIYPMKKNIKNKNGPLLIKSIYFFHLYKRNLNLIIISTILLMITRHGFFLPKTTSKISVSTKTFLTPTKNIDFSFGKHKIL